MATADKILLRLTKADRKISTVIDLTNQFNTNGSVYQDVGGWDVSVVEVINPTDTISFKTTNDDGAITGQVLPSPEVPINWIDVMGVDMYKNDVTSVNYSTLVKFINIGKYLQISTPPVPPTPNMSLTVSNTSNYFDIAENSDFTIEWNMYLAADDNHPRAYSFGSYPSAAHAVSIENGTLYWWVGGSIAMSSSVNLVGGWHHICIQRNTNEARLYIDGVWIQTTDPGYSTAIPSNGLPLYIGSEGNDSLSNGLFSNFRWNNLFAVYNPAGFTPPSQPLTYMGGCTLLTLQGNTLNLELTDNSGLNTLNNGTGIYNSNNPFSPTYQGSIQFGTV